MNNNRSKFARMKQTFWIGGGLLGAALLISSGQVLAQDEADQRGASAEALLEEIIVTARRREERLLEQPMSIAAITADQMQVQGIFSVDDVSRFVPNVTLTTDNRANNTRVVIRGIGGGFPDPVFVFGAGMYIDGHYIPTSLGGYMSTVDIERIELLRGPQGTLFGKNVVGGLVNIITTKPQPEFDSSVVLRLGEDGEQAIRGMVNVPFSDRAFGRFSVASEEFDGYYFNRNLGIDSGGKDTKAVRAAFRFVPNDHWTIDAAVGVSRKEDDNMGGQCQNILGDAPQWGGGAGNLERRLFVGAKQGMFDRCAADVAAGDFVHSSDKFTFSDVDTDTVHLAAQWDSDGAVGGLDNLTINARGSYRYMEYTYFADRDYMEWPVDAIGTSGPEGQNNETFGFELLFEADASDRLRWTAGVNYFDETALNGEDLCWNMFVASGAPNDVDPITGLPVAPPNDLIVNCPPVGLHFELVPDNPNGTDIDPNQDPNLWPNAPRINPFGPGPFQGEVSVFNKSIGIFGHATYDINDQWTLDLGVRWTEDDREFHNIEFASTGCDVSIDPNNHCAYTVPVSLFHVSDTGFFNTAADTFSEFTPLVSLTRNLTPGENLTSGMFYFLYSEGFLTGGFNTEINSNLPAVKPLLSYAPEQVNNYEIGFKGQLMGGNVQIMTDVFYMDYKDQQRSIDLANPNNEFGVEDPVGITQNVAKSKIVGLEFELRAALWEGGFVSVDLAYLENEYDEYQFDDPANPGTPVDLSNTLINDYTPDATLNVAVQHEFQLAGGSTITPRLHMYWQDDFEWASTQGDYPENGPRTSCFQDAYATFDGRVTYAPSDGDWQVAVFGGNLTDERYIEFCDTNRNVWRWRLGRPRWFGLEFFLPPHFTRTGR
ncbi:MAG: TonB-dependent receptor, partial [Woeseia sp.]